MIKLFGHPDSGHAYKVKLFLSVADIEHDYEVIDIWQPRDQRSSEFQQNARYQEVPLLLDAGKALVQSNAILIHLARKAADWGFGNDADSNRCTEWLFWEANKIGLCLPQLRSAARWPSPEFSDGAIQWLNARYEHDVNLLNNELADKRPFITGEAPTIADFSLCGYLFFADEANVIVPSNVQAWLDRIALLPGWASPYDLLSA